MLNNMPAASISRQATAPPVRNGLAGAGGQNGRPVATQCGKLSRPSSAASQNGRERSLTTGARRALMPRLLRGSGHRRRDRKSVVEGNGVLVRVGSGGGRHIQKTTNQKTHNLPL